MGLSSINILGLNVNDKLSWRSHIEGLAKSASRKLGVLFRCRSFFSSSELLKLYVRILDRVEAKAFRLINDASSTSQLDSLSLRRRVASLTIFYKYYFGNCSEEIKSIMPPPLPRPRNTRQTSVSHNFCVRLDNARIDAFNQSFIPLISRAWNDLLSSVFPASFNINLFKRRVCHHLREGQ